MNNLRLFSLSFYLYGPYKRDQRGVAPADCWNWGEWELKDYNRKGTFLGWFVGLVVPMQETFILPWLLWSAQFKNNSSPDTISIYVSPSPCNLGRQSCRAAFLWMCVYGTCFAPLRKIGKWKEWGAAHPERIFMTAFLFEVLSYVVNAYINFQHSLNSLPHPPTII